MKKLVLIFLTGIFLSNLFGWGGLAHKIITEQAMKNLPAEMPVSADWKTYVIEHCSDPDWRKDETPGESERHYIDIDYYEEFNRGEMIFDKRKLIDKYGEEVVVDIGVLPWAIEETYNNLVTAFQEQDNEGILLYASDLAHYVEDGSQPQHLILNYNGKMTDQYGIHGRYETEMIHRNEQEIRENLQQKIARDLEIDLQLIFDYISAGNSLSELIFAADLHALKYTEEYDDIYYELLWFKTKYITQIQLNYAAEYLASFIYSAWLEAGKPEIP